MTTAETPENEPVHAKRPVATWTLMACAVASVLLIPDWTNSGGLRPMWIMVFPVALGLAGAFFAAQSGRFWWAMISALWGFALVQAIVVVLTLTGGP